MSDDLVDGVLREAAQRWIADDELPAPNLVQLVTGLPGRRRSAWLPVAATVAIIVALAVALSLWSAEADRSRSVASGHSGSSAPTTQATVRPLDSAERAMAATVAHEYARQTVPQGIDPVDVEGWPANVHSVTALVGNAATASAYGGNGYSGLGDFLLIRLTGMFDGSFMYRAPSSNVHIEGTSLTLTVALPGDSVDGFVLARPYPPVELPAATVLFSR